MPTIAQQMADKYRFFPLEVAGRHRLLLSDVCIALGKWEEAERHLAFVPDCRNNPHAFLNKTLSRWARGDESGLAALVFRFSEKDFSAEKRPWFLFAKGHFLVKRSPLYGRVVLLRARDEMGDKPSRLLETLGQLSRFTEKTSLKKHEYLRELVRGMGPSYLGMRIAIEYASILSKDGEAEEALRFVAEYLTTLDASHADCRISGTLFKMALERSLDLPLIESACEILSADTDRRYHEWALETLCSDHHFWENSSCLTTLEDLFARQSRHPLRECFFVLKGEYFLRNGTPDEAKDFMEKILPQMTLPDRRADILFLLAYDSTLLTPPAYRLAADYLQEAARVSDKNFPYERITGMRADLFFLNGDYALAEELYGTLLENPHLPCPSSTAYQWILSGLMQEHLGDAKAHLQTALGKDWLSGQQKWNIRCLILDRMKRSGDAEAPTIAAELYLDADTNEKKCWVRCFFAEWHVLHDRPDEALEELAKLPNDTVETRWLRGKAFAKKLDYAAAREQWAEIRRGTETTHPLFVLSYVEEAALLANQKAYVQAQQLLLEMADKFPKHAYAPMALYLSAVHASRRGLMYANDTAALLNKLIERYPSHELVYFAKLKQGHILMALNNFAAAKQVFMQLQYDFPAHAHNAYSKFLEIKCEMAQAADVSPNAVTSLETLLTYKELTLELRLELACLLATVYGDQQRNTDLKTLLWEMVSPLLEQTTFGAGEAYWLSRCLFQLADCVDGEGNDREAQKLYRLIVQRELPGCEAAEKKLH
jgi:TolA-binding protein